MVRFIVGFSTPIRPTLFAKAIMVADNIPYDHVYVKWNWKEVDRNIIYQASKFAVNFETEQSFKNHCIALEEYELELTDETFTSILQFCVDNSNKSYGFKQILGFAWVKLNRIFGRKIQNPAGITGNEWICSAIGAAILVIAGVDLKEPIKDVDPHDLNMIIKTIPAIRRVL